MARFEEWAPAKVNLTLSVVGRRADGYHALSSLVAFAREAADHLVLDLARPPGCTVSGPFGGTLSGQNLVEVALGRLAAVHPNLKLGHIALTKSLPVAAGIGGGSADAAAVLRLVRRANPALETALDWSGIAAALGADVPVCVLSRAAWMTGIGDRVTALPPLPHLTGVLVNPLLPMPDDKTARVFRALHAPPVPAEADPPPPPPFASRAALVAYMLAHGNALEAAACEVSPVIASVKQALVETDGCRYAAVSGGGPTCFGIFDDAEAAMSALKLRHPDWWVQAVTLR